MHLTQDIAEQFYGYTPIGNMLDLINCKKGFRMTEPELIDIFDHFPKDHLWTLRIKDIFLEIGYADDIEELRALRAIQANKDFYILSVAGVVEFYETDALLSDKPYQDLIRFLKRELGLEYIEVADIMYELWDMLSSDDDPHETMQWFWNQFEFENEKQVEKIVSLYMAAANGTRMLANRGHKPMEMHSKTKFGPGHMPTIQAGSAHAANMLSQIDPEIQKMGFSLDLELNAGRMPVILFYSAILITAGIQMAECFKF